MATAPLHSTSALPSPTTKTVTEQPPTDASPRREWLETDGCGGYASSTPELCPTRRYHGLYVAPGPGTAERYNYLARFDEQLVEPDGGRWPLSVARYPGTLAPRGDLAMTSFESEPAPRATYRVGASVVARTVVMIPGKPGVFVRYELLEGEGPCVLELRPIVPFRRADHLTVENEAADTTLTPIEGGFTVQPYPSLPALAIASSVEAELEADPTWFRDLVFEDDRARGYEGREDELSPALLRIGLRPGESVVVAASLRPSGSGAAKAGKKGSEGLSPKALEKAVAGELSRRERAAKKLDPVAARLDRAADAFLYRAPIVTSDGKAGERTGILAGLPWFLEWGRDTFLALPGLTLARGRTEQCAEVLTGVLPYLRDGLLPNIFGTTPADSHYGSADAALWFARAVLLYDRAEGKRSLIKHELQPALESIAEAYLEGTGLGLFVDDEGLLHAGTPELNPTWMDARTSAGPVTPRHGCPVEIAALWCSLVTHLEELAPNKAAKRAHGELRKRAKKAFLKRFWIEDKGYLADNWVDGGRDDSVRPNMVLAAALELARES